MHRRKKRYHHYVWIPRLLGLVCDSCMFILIFTITLVVFDDNWLSATYFDDKPDDSFKLQLNDRCDSSCIDSIVYVNVQPSPCCLANMRWIDFLWHFNKTGASAMGWGELLPIYFRRCMASPTAPGAIIATLLGQCTIKFCIMRARGTIS